MFMVLLRKYQIIGPSNYEFKYDHISGLIRIKIDGDVIRINRDDEEVVRYSSQQTMCWGSFNKEVLEALRKEKSRVFYKGDYSKLEDCLTYIEQNIIRRPGYGGWLKL